MLSIAISFQLGITSSKVASWKYRLKMEIEMFTKEKKKEEKNWKTSKRIIPIMAAFSLDWVIYLTAYQLLVHYLMPEVVCTQLYIKYSYLIQVICTHLDGCKYSYLIQIICIQLDGCKYSNLIQIICT